MSHTAQQIFLPFPELLLQLLVLCHWHAHPKNQHHNKREIGMYDNNFIVVTLQILANLPFAAPPLLHPLCPSHILPGYHNNSLLLPATIYCSVHSSLGRGIVRVKHPAQQHNTVAGIIVLCSWARHFTLIVPLSTQVHKWVPAK